MRIAACGDSLFSSTNLRNRIDKRVVNYLLEADGAFSNAEFCTPRPTTPPAIGRGYITSVSQDRLDEFKSLNIRLLSFVNNHSGDYGWEGMVDTMEAAQARGLVQCGLGHNLAEARLPRFLDLPTGRVSVVATSATRSEVFAAGEAGARSVARPGTNPLRWGRAYVLPEKEFNELAHIHEILGTKASAEEGTRIETWAPPAEGTFQFGSLYEGNLRIERGDTAHVRTWVDESDLEAIKKSLRDASRRSDLTLFSLHTHEGLNENWYSEQPPEFIERVCHEAIDAGADAVIGHGAHFMRGVEIYHGKPIFYNLGSLFMEFEAGESIITPDMYQSYGYPVDSRPSDLHGNRAKDKDGNFIGFASERRFSENCMALLDLEDGRLTWRLIPLDLGLDREQPLRRGLPEIAAPEVARHMAENLTRMSARYGTRLVYRETDGSIVAE